MLTRKKNTELGLIMIEMMIYWIDFILWRKKNWTKNIHETTMKVHMVSEIVIVISSPSSTKWACILFCSNSYWAACEQRTCWWFDFIVVVIDIFCLLFVLVFECVVFDTTKRYSCVAWNRYTTRFWLTVQRNRRNLQVRWDRFHCKRTHHAHGCVCFDAETQTNVRLCSYNSLNQLRQ